MPADILDRALMIIVGLVFCAGGVIISKNSLESKNLIETAMFGLLGLTVGLFLLTAAVFGPPG